MSEQKQTPKHLNPAQNEHAAIPAIIFKWLTSTDRGLKMSPMTLLALAATIN